MKKDLTKFIFISFFAGIIFGVFLNLVSQFSLSIIQFTLPALKFGGDLFLKTIKMLVVPIVFFSLITGVANLKNISSLGRIGFKTISLYIFTTLIAITISLLVGHIINPGQGMTINENIDSFNLNEAPSFLEVLLNIIPDNPFDSLTKGNMLQIIFFSILLGGCLSSIDNNKTLLNFFVNMNDLVLKMLSVLLIVAPVGIFCLISQTFATQGFSSILELLKYFFWRVFGDIYSLMYCLLAIC